MTMRLSGSALPILLASDERTSLNEKVKPPAKILSATILFLLAVSLRAQIPRLIQPPVFPVEGFVTNSVIAADFNGDGLPDLASANEQFGTLVDVLLNDGDGTFQTLSAFTAGDGPVRPAAGDLNGDGKLDLVVPNFGLDFRKSDKLRVFLGNGDGTFQAGPISHVGNFPDSAAVGDFNGDGKLDVAVTNGASPVLQAERNGAQREQSPANSGTVQVLLGNGDGTLQPPVSYATAENPVRVAVGDLNGDGVPDLVVAEYSDTAISVLLGLGDGNFAPRQDYGAGRAASDVALADLNNDGKIDVAAAESGEVSVLLNNGDGTLAPGVDMPLDQPASSIVAGDLDRDGEIDLVATHQLTSIYFGNGDGTFKAPIDYLPGQTVVVSGEFDAKPGLDLVVDGATSTTLGVAFLSNRGDGTFFAPRAYSAPISELTMATRDLDGDGKPDLIATSGQPSTVDGAVLVYLNNGTGEFPDRVDYGVGELPQALAVADVTGDGKDDLAVANKLDKTVSILFGKGDGSFHPANNFTTGTAAPQGIAAGDFNGDGKQDLVTSNFGLPGTIGILLSVNGSFPAHTDLPVATAPTTVLAKDFSGDGNADIAVAYTNSSQQINAGIVSVLISKGNGTFQPRVDYPLDPGFDMVLLSSGDVNVDGKLDLVAVRSVGATALLLGNGDGTFQSPINSPSAQIYPYPFSAGVELADLDGDAVLDLVLVTNASVCFGNGDGTFQAPQYFSSAGTYNFNAVAAADYDGDGAVDVAYGTGNISILSNTGGSHLKLISSKNPSQVGEKVTFASKVAPTFPVGIPTGTVSFFDGSNSLGTASLVGGKAKLSVSTLSAGKHFIQAHYNGDAIFVPNDSRIKTQIVKP